jgi:NAD(P)-dependent dehydrogenase (short-subunit alcohol dehydrogenase family)
MSPSRVSPPVALVTGASAGIGAATVVTLMSAGWIVYAAARRLDRMQSLADAGALTVPLDLEDDASIVQCVAHVSAQHGRLNALINNAGYGAYGALEDLPAAEARRQFDVNVLALGRITQLALPLMRATAAAQSGVTRIVNISSIGGRIHEPMGSWYHATKFAVEGLSDCLRMELAPMGIDVVVVQPGAIKTEWSGIAQRSLLHTSGDTAYAAQAHATAALLAGADHGSGADPEVVARVVRRAITVRRPRTRYAVGGGAYTLLTLRWLLPDRVFDAVMRLAIRSMQPRIASRASDTPTAGQKSCDGNASDDQGDRALDPTTIKGTEHLIRRSRGQST